jgi:hypothetical protein
VLTAIQRHICTTNPSRMRSRGSALLGTLLIGTVFLSTEAHAQSVTGGSTLGFLTASSYGPATGSGTITYTDGTTASFTLTAPDWWGGASAGTVAYAPTYLNAPGNAQQSQPVDVYFVAVPLTSTKTVATVQLPNVSAAPAVEPTYSSEVWMLGKDEHHPTAVFIADPGLTVATIN